MRKLLFIAVLLNLICMAHAQDDFDKMVGQLDTIKNVKAKIDLLNDIALVAINNDPEERYPRDDSQQCTRRAESVTE